FMNTINLASQKLELLAKQELAKVNVTLKHRDLVGLILVLYPDACKDGICHGVALMGAQMILSESFLKFKRRLARLSEIVDKYPGDPGKKDYELIMREIKECPLDQKNDFMAFFEGLHICMEGYRYEHLFPLESKIIDQSSEKFKVSALALIASEALEAKGEIFQITNFCGAYTRLELSDYFNSLNEVLLQEPYIKDSIVMVLEDKKHTIVVGCNAREKIKFFIDSNRLNKMEFSDVEELADAVALSFRGRSCAFTTRVLVVGKQENSTVEFWEKKIKDWRDSRGFRDIHAFIPGSKKNPSWLTIAAKNGHLNTVENLLAIGTKITEKDSLDSLFLAVKYQHLDVVNSILSSLNSVHDLDLLQGVLSKQEADGSTILMYASQYGYSEVVKSIVSFLGLGLDHNLLSETINKQGPNDFTALILAAERGHLEVVEILLTSLAGNPPILLDCINKQRFDGFSAFMKAS
ncbi:MAG: ankyrin repeat domain-containing protein, partial [Verrucomicrobia bacterium]|nr:ankyrin repeat domain-containing protein [Verrucomicrobiota bacterium]